MQQKWQHSRQPQQQRNKNTYPNKIPLKASKRCLRGFLIPIAEFVYGIKVLRFLANLGGTD